MAGIGFELRKLFVGRGAIAKVRAYAYAGIITAGTMMLAVLMMVGVQWLVRAFGATDQETETLVVLMVYAMLGSLLVSSLLQMLLSRYVADMLYQKKTERVLPSLFGGSSLLMAVGGVAYGAFLWPAHAIPVLDRLLNWGLFITLILVWLQMAYITAAKDYRRILLGFAGGVAAVFLLGGALLSVGVRPTTAVMAALFCGYGVMLVAFNRVLLSIFPVGSGSLLAFVEWIGRYPDLVLVGFLSMAGAFVHLIVMWFSPLGDLVAGQFRHAPLHDSAAFFAYLVAVPTGINFVVSVEVNFYLRYKRYFTAITNGGTLAEIRLARKNMEKALHQEIFRLTEVQLFIMVVYTILGRYLLESLGFTRDMIGIFQVMCIGYSAYAIGNCFMLLQLYFNDRKGALLTCAVYFVVNLAGTLFTMNRSPLTYGLGMTVAGILMYMVGVLRLLTYVRDIDYHVFCGQPILATRQDRWPGRLAARLDERVKRFASPIVQTAGKEEISR
ncbi:MAG: exopolysaccharide Pel transporter PelG [Clostridiales bacterium]|nr:exopolysaccharide Pel transporter PelG [Clostridiales bacterium]